MIKKILEADNPELRKNSREVINIDKKIREVIKDLKDTIYVQKDPEGVGLAAPQLGKDLRIFVMKPKDLITVVINPNIVQLYKSGSEVNRKNRKTNKIMEGCLSLPNYYSPIERAFKVNLEYINEEGKKIIGNFEGMDAQIIQHEIDHLNGILFVDRLLEQKKPLYEYINGEWEKVDLPS